MIAKAHTGPPPGSAEISKQAKNLNICEKLAKLIKPIYGPNMGFRAEYETEFSSTRYHLVRNKLVLYLEDGKVPEPRLVELKINNVYPCEPNQPRVKCLKIMPGDNGRSPPPR